MNPDADVSVFVHDCLPDLAECHHSRSGRLVKVIRKPIGARVKDPAAFLARMDAIDAACRDDAACREEPMPLRVLIAAVLMICGSVLIVMGSLWLWLR